MPVMPESSTNWLVGLVIPIAVTVLLLFAIFSSVRHRSGNAEPANLEGPAGASDADPDPRH